MHFRIFHSCGKRLGFPGRAYRLASTAELGGAAPRAHRGADGPSGAGDRRRGGYWILLGLCDRLRCRFFFEVQCFQEETLCAHVGGSHRAGLILVKKEKMKEALCASEFFPVFPAGSAGPAAGGAGRNARMAGRLRTETRKVGEQLRAGHDAHPEGERHHEPVHGVLLSLFFAFL